MKGNDREKEKKDIDKTKITTKQTHTFKSVFKTIIFSVEINRSTSVLGCDSPSGAFTMKHNRKKQTNNN